MADQNVITREEATAQIIAAKKQRGSTFEQIAKAIGRHKVWVTAALMGQASMSKEEAEKTVSVLGLGEGVASAVIAALQESPMKGSLDSAVPVDPTRSPRFTEPQ